MTTSSKESVFQEIPETFTFHEDSAHGWMEVPYQLLVTLNIHKDITDCSYRNGDTTFLEEDFDLSTFIDAFDKFFNSDPNIGKMQFFWDDRIIRKYEDTSLVRSFQRFYLD